MYKIKNESEHHYEIETPEGSSFHVAKEGLSDTMHANIRKLCEGGVAHYAEGTDGAEVADAEPTAEAPVTADTTEVPPIQETTAPTGAIKEQAGAQDVGINRQPMSEDVGKKYSEAIEKERVGTREAAEAQANLGKANATILKDHVLTAQNALVNHQAEENQRLTTQANLAKDIAAAKIDPHQYFDKLSTVGQIGTILSLVLGGVGAGHTNGVNQAVGALNDQISKDVEAQKANLENKNSLYAKNLQAMGDARAAFAATQSQQLSIAQAKLAAEAAKNQTPQAQAAYTVASAALDKQQAQISQQMFLYKMQSKLQSGEPFDAKLSPFATHPGRVVNLGDGTAIMANSDSGAAKVAEAQSKFNPAIEALKGLSETKINPANKLDPKYQAAVSVVKTLPLLLKNSFGVGRLNKEFQDIVENAAANPTDLLEAIRSHEPRTTALLKTLQTMKSEAIAPHVSGYRTRSSLGAHAKRD